MKFSCDRCGKKYATAETPAPGRVYKLKCKACGHLIVVKTPASGPTVNARTPPPAGPAIAATSAGPSPSQPEVEPSDAAPVQQGSSSQFTASGGEPTAEISMLTSTEEAKGSAAEEGYVDIFADASTPAPEGVEDDPFLKAARGSLPEGFAPAPGLSDPFSDMRSEIEGPREPPPSREVPPPSAFAPPVRAADDRKKSGLPVALIGFGFAVVVGIVVLVALTSGRKVAPPAPAPPPLVTTTPAPPSPPAEVPEPTKVKDVVAGPEGGARREERKRTAEKKVAKVEPKPRPPAPAPLPRPEPKPEPKPVARAEPSRPVELPDAESALSPAAVQRVVNASRRAFELCIEQAARKGTGSTFDGRKVSLRLNVNPNGFVTYPTLDDVTLNREDLGECLKAAARLMVFPKFQGDVFHVEVPLTLRGG